MPVHRSGRRGCFQWGHHGAVYCGAGARQRAERQGRAAHARGYRGREAASTLPEVSALTVAAPRRARTSHWAHLGSRYRQDAEHAQALLAQLRAAIEGAHQSADRAAAELAARPDWPRTAKDTVIAALEPLRRALEAARLHLATSSLARLPDHEPFLAARSLDRELGAAHEVGEALRRGLSAAAHGDAAHVRAALSALFGERGSGADESVLLAEPDLSYLLGPRGAVRAIGPEDGPEPPVDGIARYRSPHGSTRYVYYVDGAPVSALQVMSRDRRRARVANVWTAPHARRRGYATRLLQRARRDFETVEHSDDLSPDARAWVDRVGETGPREARGSWAVVWLQGGEWVPYQRDLSRARASRLARDLQYTLSPRWYGRNVPAKAVPDSAHLALREDPADPADWQGYLGRGEARYVDRVVLPQMPDVVARAAAAGMPPGVEYVGAGMTGVVFCAGDVAFKVARDTRPIDHSFFEDEAEWLASAAAVPDVAARVARIHRFDPDRLVIVRDCPHPDPDQSHWRWESKLSELHRFIEQQMLPHGWTAPEFKPDSYVLTARGPVLVDASLPMRVGAVLAQYVEDVVAGARPLWTRNPHDLTFYVRREVGQTLTQAEADHLQAILVERWPEARW